MEMDGRTRLDLAHRYPRLESGFIVPRVKSDDFSHISTMLYTIAFLVLAGSSGGLNHGRDAKPGELPYVVRVRIQDLEEDARRLAAGVLVSTTRVLTTCDTVGYFTGETVNLYDLRRVTLLAGTVERDNWKEAGGVLLLPSASSHHPWCHLLASEMVLFNLGFFDVDDPGFPLSDTLKPFPQKFASKSEALDVTYNLYYRRTLLKCVTAGWGYPTMAFEDKVEPDFFNSSSLRLQVADVIVVGYEGPGGCLETTCKEFGDCLVNIFEYGLVCAMAKRGGPCRNDRGAPLVCEDTLSGILTNPQRCEDRGIPRHFVRIDLVYDYVYSITAGADSTSSNLFVVAMSSFLGLRWAPLY